jgi:hypothetical protein
MNSLRYFLILTLNLLVLIGNAQDFKVIKDKKHYILKEVNRTYFDTNGIEPKNEFVIDTSVVFKENGILKLVMENGRFIELRDKIGLNSDCSRIFSYRGYDKRGKNYLVEGNTFGRHHYYLVNKNSETIEPFFDKPRYSSSDLFYVYCPEIEFKSKDGRLIFVNLKTDKQQLVNFTGYVQYGFKWLDDKSFMFQTKNDVLGTSYNNNSQYYLVQIKQ